MARKFNTEGQCNPNIHYMVRAVCLFKRNVQTILPSGGTDDRRGGQRKQQSGIH